MNKKEIKTIKFASENDALQYLADITNKKVKISAKVDKSDIQFVRWGGLSSVKQKGYDIEMPTFHSPPTRRGIYAFVWPYIEKFLLGSSIFKPYRMKWLKDKNGKKIKYEEGKYEKGTSVWKNEKNKNKFENLLEKNNNNNLKEDLEKIREDGKFLAEHIRPKKFKYKGDLWHHLKVKNKDILQRKGDWVKTSFENYKKALYKELGSMDIYKKRTGISYSLDHLEVFIEKV